MKIQVANSHTSFKGNLIVNNPGTSYIGNKIRDSKVIQNFVKKFDGNIYVDSLSKTASNYDIYKGSDEEVFKVFLSNAPMPPTLWGRIKAFFNPAFSSTSLTRHYRDERLIGQAIDNERKLQENLNKLKAFKG